ncbi:hypothetical protein F2P56_024893 [Juglans regia]|uniref:Proline-rich protein 3-like n=2 Tax=Juglans regia TaxID=51240 RepID=A0A833UCE5_JUGRE|nr:proline-rich protein 3-like [Juglans regia]KAF5455298.1 hypothetical protein F2P56_024893 [Juglans regia]
MIPKPFLSSTLILLLSLLVIASASDYGYAPKPDYGKPKPEYKPLPTEQPDYKKPNSEGNDKPIPTKPNYEKPESEGNDKPLPTKPEYEKPEPEGQDQPLPTKPDHYEKPNLEGILNGLLPSGLIGIQGLVLCKSGSNYIPLKGAMVRITCLAVDENGYETAPFSIFSDECDAKGYFLTKISPAFLKDNWKIKECKAFQYHSPLETCKVPIDVNHGMSGAPLSSYRVLEDKNMNLYSVGPFFYTTDPQTSLPNGY